MRKAKYRVPADWHQAIVRSAQQVRRLHAAGDGAPDASTSWLDYLLTHYLSVDARPTYLRFVRKAMSQLGIYTSSAVFQRLKEQPHAQGAHTQDLGLALAQLAGSPSDAARSATSFVARACATLEHVIKGLAPFPLRQNTKLGKECVLASSPTWPCSPATCALVVATVMSASAS